MRFGIYFYSEAAGTRRPQTPRPARRSARRAGEEENATRLAGTGRSLPPRWWGWCWPVAAAASALAATGMASGLTEGTVNGFGSVFVDGDRFDDDSEVATTRETAPGVATQTSHAWASASVEIRQGQGALRLRVGRR